ncbi:MAG TPA: hypothetical protein VMV22_00050 [Acidimicrobiales bacterium]|nr:hypothetical protein [Acidimicrobiales bacterium]
MSPARRRRFLIAVPVLVGATLVARRLGYKVGGNVVVRCRDGHLFTTIWIPGASFKAVRLGWWRLQRCPVGKHWTLVTPVKDADLSDEERASAELHRDVRIP